MTKSLKWPPATGVLTVIRPKHFSSRRGAPAPQGVTIAAGVALVALDTFHESQSFVVFR
jgi:hypothetical protein